MVTLLRPDTAVNVPGALNVSLPASMPPPKTPIFEVPIAMI
jgi:hypothetical protein